MGYIISFGYSQGAIWFYNLRAPQICFRNFWDQKIDQVETQDGCVIMPKESNLLWPQSSSSQLTF